MTKIGDSIPIMLTHSLIGSALAPDFVKPPNCLIGLDFLGSLDLVPLSSLSLTKCTSHGYRLIDSRLRVKEDFQHGRWESTIPE